ncbi:hypothetical protein [Bartonella birtlesii]|uniref:Uncharacterized protein n=1 Tax=Bartonella birtlesii LL-WM9 TaxID=1094552 RepID=J0Q1Z0_9HYPH|nr:hypothetical protein [Bartonella birtlesii]EJF76574.1 hypothetical protein ME7_00831 [Bartonella birtlesii LL-WM9]
MNNYFMVPIIYVLLFSSIIFIFVILFVLAFYYSVLKRIKMYFQVEKELEWVLQENDIGLQQLRREQAMQQQRCAQKQP